MSAVTKLIKQPLQDLFLALQKVGTSLMLPVSVLPIAGLLMGVGAADWGDLPWFVQYMLDIMQAAGESVFAALPLIFALGVALGFTNNDGVAALSATVGFGVMLATMAIMGRTANEPIVIDVCAQLTGELQNAMLILNQACDYSVLSKLKVLPDDAVPLREVFGIFTIDTGVLGGVLVGLLTATLFNRYHRIALPDYLGFFSGKRFIPIITALTAMLLGFVLYFIWPPIGQLISSFSNWAAYKDPALAFGIYGFVERALIPLGLHHIWNVPFFLEAGGACAINGDVLSVIGDSASCSAQGGYWITGEIRRFLSGDPVAGNLAGGYLFKMWGLPAAAIAMWHSASPENRVKVGSIMVSAALTAFLTGVTEPIEFSFIFVAPILYAIHAVLAGLAYTLTILMEMKHGMAFSHGAIDFFLFARLAHNIEYFFILGPIYAGIYYVIFRVAISKLNLATPGRKREIKTKQRRVKKEIRVEVEPLLEALGGATNLTSLNACITRLRVGVSDPDIVNKAQLESLGAAAVVSIGRAVQVVFGPASENIKTDIDRWLEAHGIEVGDTPPSIPLPMTGKATADPASDAELQAFVDQLLPLIGGADNIDSVLVCATSRVRIKLKQGIELPGQTPDSRYSIMRIHDDLYHLLGEENAEGIKRLLEAQIDA